MSLQKCTTFITCSVSPGSIGIYIYINNCLIVPLIVHPVTSVQVPAASHVTVEELTVPSYPGAHDTDDVSPYVVPVVLV